MEQTRSNIPYAQHQQRSSVLGEITGVVVH